MPVLGKGGHPLWIGEIILHAPAAPVVEMFAVDQIEAELPLTDQRDRCVPCCWLVPGRGSSSLLAVGAPTNVPLLPLCGRATPLRRNVMIYS